ncbi:succinyl-CoA ligase [ADP-forming] subunit beta [Acrasis kona]|uniref:Succinyl-CoA ligase [ADP-forming] subunit beta n=1 Tax=Acrasis kona TaxID=1008807 RepID=A0AAW2ZKU1_9EUKA
MIEDVSRSGLLYAASAVCSTCTAGYLLYKKYLDKSIPSADAQIKHELITFTGLTTTTTCVVASATYYADNDRTTAAFPIMFAGCMFVPVIVAKGIEWYYRKEEDIVNTTMVKHAYSNKTAYLGAAIVGAIAVDTILISSMLPGNRLSKGSEHFVSRLSVQHRAKIADEISNMSLGRFIPKALAGVFIGGLSINTLLAYMEERGWRHFMYKRLDQLLGRNAFWTHSLITGATWGLFHVPLIFCGSNYPNNPLYGAGQFIVACMVYSPLFKYIVDKSQEEEEETHESNKVFVSGVVAAMLHGVMNATGSLSLMFVNGGSDLSNGLAGWAGISAFAIADVALWLYQSTSCCARK